MPRRVFGNNDRRLALLLSHSGFSAFGDRGADAVRGHYGVLAVEAVVHSIVGCCYWLVLVYFLLCFVFAVSNASDCVLFD